VHLVLMWCWAVQFGLVWMLSASARIPYLIVVSIYANFVGHWSAYSAETPVESEEELGG
jgi:hypothetical protein